MTASTTRWFPNSMPAPIVDHHTLPWWQACAEHKLTAQRCTNTTSTDLQRMP